MSRFNNGGGGGGGSLNIKTSGFPFPDDLIAFWDFSESQAPYQAKAGVDKFPLYVGGSSAPTRVNELPFGSGLKFNGTNQYLKIASDDVGALNVGRVGDEVTVVAWIKRPVGTATQNGFIGGMWQEDNTNPRRQYGMFTNLPMYGGQNRVCGHISKTGGASPNLPYSRDYSTSGTYLGANDEVRFLAMTYDGQQIKSYVDGICDLRTTYTEPEAPNGEGLTYAKNPYQFDLGLNRTSVSDFTVGAVKLTAGMNNFFNAILCGLAVFSRSLTDKELMRMHLASLPPGKPIIALDADNDEWTGNKTPDGFGWKSYRGATAVDMSTSTPVSWTFARVSTATSQPFAFVTSEGSADQIANTSNANFIEKTGIKNINMSQLSVAEVIATAKTAGNTGKLCIKVDGKWYASVTDITHPGTATSGADWSTEVVTTIPITRAKANWLSLTVTPGTSLALGTTPTADIPNKEVQGIGIYAPPLKAGSIFRFRSIKIYS